MALQGDLSTLDLTDLLQNIDVVVKFENFKFALPAR